MFTPLYAAAFRRRASSAVALVALGALVGCSATTDQPNAPGGGATAAPKSASNAAAAPQHIDSALPRPMELERFREGLGKAPTSLAGGAATRDALVRIFLEALAAKNTTTLQRLLLSRAEFAWLYYPTNPIGRPPYDLSPGLMWFQLEGNSSKGLAHALSERGGSNLHVVDWACESVERQGDNRLHSRCAVRRVQAKGDTIREYLFGGILERDGQFKFISYANKL